ncbi:MAG: hypothetical protein ACD_72C00297G0005 [uncultured bacterium]|nr:MAG: hypothetical protein ACD_72C00297G0005 [uncultured bacterium]
MKNSTLTRLVLFSSLLLFPLLAHAETPPSIDGIKDVYGKAVVPAYLVAEYPSGKIISGKNIDVKNQIASLTKLITAYTVRQENLNLQNSTPFRWKKFNTGRIPKKAFRFSEGEMVKNQDVLELMLVISNNSASRMLAAATGLKEKDFIAKMNNNVAALGMDNTALFDTSGLNNKNVSTARNLLTIFMVNLADPQLASSLGRPIYTFKSKLGKRTVDHTIHSSNLIPSLYKKRDYDILASKTGFTGQLSTIAMLVKSKLDGKQYVVITLGNPNYAKRFLVPHQIAQWVSKDLGVASLASVGNN